MGIFESLSSLKTIFLIIGAILCFFGLILKRSAKKETAMSILSTLFVSVGVMLLLFVVIQWIADGLNNWSFVSDRML